MIEQTASSARERRDETRIPLQMPIRMRTALGEMTLMTDNISAGGVFVKTDTPMRLHQRVRLRVHLPGTSEPLSLTAIVAHIVSPFQDMMTGPGVGLSFERPSLRACREWEGFVSLIDTFRDPNLDAPIVLASEEALDVEPSRRAHPRVPIALEAHIETEDDLFVAATGDVSLGGAYINTLNWLPNGTHLRLILIHPIDETEFEANATVVRSGAGPGGEANSGLGLSFETLDPGRTQLLMLFLESAQLCVPVGPPSEISLPNVTA